MKWLLLGCQTNHVSATLQGSSYQQWERCKVNAEALESRVTRRSFGVLEPLLQIDVATTLPLFGRHGSVTFPLERGLFQSWVLTDLLM